VRERLDSLGVVPSKSLKGTREGQWVTVAGYPVRPHRPPTKSGKIIVFMSLEDEFGLADVTVFEDIYQKFGQVIFKDPCSLLLVRGKVNRRGNGTSVIAFDIRELEPAQ
jgi:error-prone DNA polymerase